MMNKEELEQLRDLISKYNQAYNKPYPTLGSVEMLLLVNNEDDQVYKSKNHFNLM